MNGCFLNMNNVDIGRINLNPLEKHISDIIIILNKYFYSDINLMNTLVDSIKNSTGGDTAEITRSFTTKFSISVKISKGLKKTIKKHEKKKGIPDDVMFGTYFFSLLEKHIMCYYIKRSQISFLEEKYTCFILTHNSHIYLKLGHL